MRLEQLFPAAWPVIGVIHLLPLPGAPRFGGQMTPIFDHALAELDALSRGGVDGVIVENFSDVPFYPARVPAETVAAIAAITREVVTAARVPVGVNVLRNDAAAAVAVATATGAAFVRVNVHTGVVMSEQGLLVGASHETLRLRAALKSQVAIFADVGVKHAAPLAGRGLVSEAIDTAERGLADALIVSGDRTGSATAISDVTTVAEGVTLPVLVGSGATADNVGAIMAHADGVIVGTHLKRGGIVTEPVDPRRVTRFVANARDTG
jgi:membrane complex biogenesis BtpA family protein